MMSPSAPKEDSPAGDKAECRFFEALSPEFLIHELKDPLSVIETGLRTLLERQDKYGPLSQRQDRTLRRVLRNTCKAREMLYSLLEAGRAEAACFSCAPFQPVPALIETILDAVETVDGAMADDLRSRGDEATVLAGLADAGIVVALDDRCRKRSIEQDETKFRTIVANLLKNALHHRQRQVALRLTVDGDWLTLEVVDDGPGIKPEHRDLIFQRYARVTCDPGVQRRGHGLGLAGALLMARSLGGDLSVDSRSGSGARFRFTLPFDLPRSDPP